MERSVNRMMDKGIAHFLFCLGETTRLRKREGGSGKARGMSGEELVSLCRRHVGHSISPHTSPVSPPLCSSHFCSRQLCTGAGRQHLTSGRCACPAFCPASLPLPPGKPPEVYSITKEPKTYHPLGLPFTSRRSEMMDKHAPSVSTGQFLGLCYTLSQKVPNRIQSQVPTAWV